MVTLPGLLSYSISKSGDYCTLSAHVPACSAMLLVLVAAVAAERRLFAPIAARHAAAVPSRPALAERQDRPPGARRAARRAARAERWAAERGAIGLMVGAFGVATAHRLRGRVAMAGLAPVPPAVSDFLRSYDLLFGVLTSRP